MLRTNSQGITWDTLVSGYTHDLRQVTFTDSLTGFAVGGPQFYPLILKTTDGGSNWDSIPSATGNKINDIFFPSANIGYTVGDYGVVQKSVDAGESWNMIVTGGLDSVNLNEVYFIDESIGYAVGGEAGMARIMVTMDGGSSWTIQTSPVSSELNAIYFPTNSLGYIAGNDGSILKIDRETGMLESNSVNLISVYPNPASSTIYFSETETDVGYVYDVFGKSVVVVSGNEADVSHLPNGIYFLQVGEETKKFVISR